MQNKIKILALGDIVGDPGLDCVFRNLNKIKKEKNIDVCVVNGENSAQTNGITKKSADELFKAGADVITTGNHVYKKKSSYEFLDSMDIIRPYNFNDDDPGKGYLILDKGSYKIAFLNLIGRVYMMPYNNPFAAAKRFLEKTKDCKIKIVDFHAEATSEKRAMGFFLNGKVSAIYGTHTHVQTADAQILSKGTGYITDLGMCGNSDNVIGVAPEMIIKNFTTCQPHYFTFEQARENAQSINGCIFTIDTKSGKTVDIETLRIEKL
ncbi:MAG: TIGR00282 family metallophosphoesterase [Clostridia bacterium]|nr:TIGR00282 family metallophosphoesterase [Clostridia bacterium]